VTPPIQRNPLPIVPVVLTVTTGLVDAISVLGLGLILTANMTGQSSPKRFLAACTILHGLDHLYCRFPLWPVKPRRKIEVRSDALFCFLIQCDRLHIVPIGMT
jgi:hypothetical protein